MRKILTALLLLASFALASAANYKVIVRVPRGTPKAIVDNIYKAMRADSLKPGIRISNSQFTALIAPLASRRDTLKLYNYRQRYPGLQWEAVKDTVRPQNR